MYEQHSDISEILSTFSHFIFCEFKNFTLQQLQLRRKHKIKQSYP